MLTIAYQLTILRTYRTVLACNSTGAPESTAAATTSPGSLPSITRFGIGEKHLHTLAFILQRNAVAWLTKSRDLRGRDSLADGRP